MKISELIHPDNVKFGLEAGTKTRALHILAAKASAALGIEEERIFTALHQREKLGSTGIGNGVAIPHTSLPDLKRPFGLLARLAKPVNFESMDGIPVDLIFVLLTPADDRAMHVNALAAVSRQIRSKKVLDALRHADDAHELYAAIVADTV
jgi:PTS system nitrogen regulatory IIA component